MLIEVGCLGIDDAAISRREVLAFCAVHLKLAWMRFPDVQGYYRDQSSKLFSSVVNTSSKYRACVRSLVFFAFNSSLRIGRANRAQRRLSST